MKHPDSTTNLNHLLRIIGFVPATELGIIPEKPRATVADGTFMESRTNRYGQKTCQHGRYKCDCQRIYTDPLARRGYDHHEERYVYGHSLNVGATFNKEEDLALMLAISPHPASRHDGVATLSTIARLLGTYPECKKTYLLVEAASDNTQPLHTS